MLRGGRAQRATAVLSPRLPGPAVAAGSPGRRRDAARAVTRPSFVCGLDAFSQPVTHSGVWGTSPGGGLLPSRSRGGRCRCRPHARLTRATSARDAGHGSGAGFTLTRVALKWGRVGWTSVRQRGGRGGRPSGVPGGGRRVVLAGDQAQRTGHPGHGGRAASTGVRTRGASEAGDTAGSEAWTAEPFHPRSRSKRAKRARRRKATRQNGRGRGCPVHDVAARKSGLTEAFLRKPRTRPARPVRPPAPGAGFLPLLPPSPGKSTWCVKRHLNAFLQFLSDGRRPGPLCRVQRAAARWAAA